MKNFPVTFIDQDDNKKKTGWVSRSISVSGFVFCYDFFLCQWLVLANKRGKGVSEFKGYWNCPCGYLKYNESASEAMSRKILEETGIEIMPEQLSMCAVNSSPEENHQNVVIRYFTILEKDYTNYLLLTDEYSQKDKVEDIEWIPVNKIDQYQWAFNHDIIIAEIFNNYVDISLWKKIITKLYNKYCI